MRFVIEHGTVPPLIRLEDADVFDTFSIAVVLPSHAWVDPATVAELAGPQDDGWSEQLRGMLDVAERYGWLDAEGRIRAHITVLGPDSAEGSAPCPAR